AARVVNQRGAVRRPVRRFERLSRTMDELAASGGDLEDFQMTSYVIPVRNEVGLRRTNDSHVAEDRLLDDVRVMGTEEQPGINLVAQRQIGLTDCERFTEPRSGEGVIASFPLKLDEVGSRCGRTNLFGKGTRCPPKLQRGEAVSVHGRVRVGRVFVQRGPRDPAQFPMRVHAFAYEFHSSLKDEIAFYSFPQEMKLIPVRPHVHP